jgi:outer membrane immunogenic protein
MRRNFGWALAAFVSLGFSGVGTAMAADMPLKARPAPIPMVAVYNWTGFYIGGNIGAIGSTGKSVHECINPAGVPNGALCDVIPDSDFNGVGVIGGVQAGYNWQTGNWVFGIEADGQGTSLKNSSTIVGAFPLNPPPPGFADPPGTIFSTAARLDWLATVRGRIGITSGAALFYVTGGGAFGGVRTATNLIGPLNSYPSTTDSNRAGWTVGGGVEWGFAPQWSVKAEGLYYDLGRVTSLGPSVPLVTAFNEGAHYEINGWIARVGVNYRFGGPVVAKY